MKIYKLKSDFYIKCKPQNLKVILGRLTRYLVNTVESKKASCLGNFTSEEHIHEKQAQKKRSKSKS